MPRLGPDNGRLIGSKILVNCALIQGSRPLLQFESTEEGDHGAVVDAVHARGRMR